MKTNTLALNDKGFRFPPEMISHAVWLSFRFSLSFRDVEELLAQRGIVVTDETVRQWCLTFGQTDANELRRRRLRCGDTWHVDEVYREHQRENALSLESGGSGWQRACYFGAEPT
jgi:putative transposase